MHLLKKNFSIAIIPLLVIIWGIFLYLFFDPFYSKSVDPEFPYLINGLNCALLKFNYIGHIDHPGTPLQVFNGIVIRITHLISGKGDIAQDVFARPELYLNAISNSLLLIQAFLMFAVGFMSIRRKIPFWQIAILQATCFFSSDLVWFFARVNPDRFFMIVGLIFIVIYLKHGYENRSSRKFAIWSGVAMALGMATKINFLPVLLIPLLLVDGNKNRLIYIGSGIVSFFVFIAPIIDKFGAFRSFIEGIFKHDGLYGGGEAKVLNYQKMMESASEIFRLNPGLYLLIATLVAMTLVAIRKRKEGTKGFAFLFVGFLFVIALQMLMVSKHFKNYYLAPLFVFYGFMFFSISIFLSKIIVKKSRLILASLLLPLLFVILTFVKVKDDYAVISGIVDHRVKIRKFVDAEISKDDFWFVQPTWEGAPFMENALIYGLSYCGHRIEYMPQLMAVNPNIVTYEYNNDEVKLWRGAPVKLDSVVATGKNIHIYSSPGRQASILMQLVNDAAIRNNIQLSVDTIYSDSETKHEIVRAKAMNSSSEWKPSYAKANDRQSKINEFIEAIKNSPEWLEQVKAKAIKKNISLDSMILLDAIHMTNVTK